MGRSKLGLRTLYAVAIGQAITAPLALAAMSPNDFYCRKVPVQFPVLQLPAFFKAHVQGCSDGKNASPPQSICVENAYCTYVSEDVKATDVVSAGGSKKKFKDLSPAEKSKYLVDNVDPSDWFPSTLSCAKTSPAGSTECPAIDHCRGDINYRWNLGSYSQEDTMGYLSVPAQSSGAFQNADEPDASKEGPAK